MRLTPTQSTEFVSLLAYELRTPLTTLHGALGMMHDFQRLDAADALRLLELARRSAARMQRLVDDCLDLEAHADRRLEIASAVVCPSDIVTAALRALPAAPNGVRIHQRLEATHMVHGDADRLARALAHLVRNALSFAPDGSVVALATSESALPGMVRFVVKDHGPGIPPQNLSRLFRRFVAADAAGRREVSGAGVGLAFVRAVAERHGGRVGVASEPGCTRIWFDVPVHGPRAA